MTDETGSRADPMPDSDEAEGNEALATVVAVALAGFATFVIWAIFGQVTRLEHTVNKCHLGSARRAACNDSAY